MTRLEQIIEETRTLSRPERLHLRHILDLELQTERSPETTSRTSDHNDEHIRQERLRWLKAHREEYAGQYVELDGTVLVGNGRTIREAHEQSIRNGVEKPFLVHLTSESEVLFAGW